MILSYIFSAMLIAEKFSRKMVNLKGLSHRNIALETIWVIYLTLLIQENSQFVGRLENFLRTLLANRQRITVNALFCTVHNSRRMRRVEMNFAGNWWINQVAFDVMVKHDGQVCYDHSNLNPILASCFGLKLNYYQFHVDQSIHNFDYWI